MIENFPKAVHVETREIKFFYSEMSIRKFLMENENWRRVY